MKPKTKYLLFSIAIAVSASLSASKPQKELNPNDIWVDQVKDNRVYYKVLLKKYGYVLYSVGDDLENVCPGVNQKIKYVEEKEFKRRIDEKIEY